MRVPSQPESLKISTLARVPSFPLHEQQGILWIWMGSGEAPSCEPPPYPPSPPALGGRRLSFAAELIEAPFLETVGNAFDKAHLPFIHRGTFGPAQDPLVARQRITVDPDGRGLRAEDDPDSPWHVEPKLPRGVLGLFGRLLGLRRPSAQHMRFDVEGVVRIFIEYPNGTYDVFVTYFTPADEAHTWLFLESVRTRAPHAVGDWIQRRVIRKVFEEGERETSLILAAGPDDAPRPVSVEADRVGLAARQLYERWARGGKAAARARDPAIEVVNQSPAMGGV